ncbi:MAG: hypothetical protein KGK33_02240 [Hyphomicrobiales bacterium]|nr:hypothetical protein [Hyphomicrobiales bacterium]MDE1973102.1 hypothetical protein [Hyphomicrobiales bacterium]MDE2283417.1 hypothetical protein [Hyphomicrobiales bacterium]
MAVSDSAELRVRSPSSHPWLAEAVDALDERLRRSQAVFEYTDDPTCVFRLDITRAGRSIELRDGTRIRAGQRIARLHLWSEQIPPVPENGPTIGWARHMQRAMVISLHELARFLAVHPDLNDVAVIAGDAPSGTADQREQLARIMARFGFEAVIAPEHLPVRERLHRLGENILISLIVFVHNARALRHNTLMRVRLPIYLSRRTLEREFGGISREH